MTSIELCDVISLDVDGGQIIITPPATVAVSGPSGSSLVVEGLADCTSVEVWVGEDWSCLIGLEDGHLVEAVPSAGLVRVIGELQRLDFEGGYDPGGFERVTYHGLLPQDVLIEYEVGLARASRNHGLSWDVAHGDVTAHVVQLDENEVWLEGEGDRFGFRLVDGTPIWS